MEKDEDECHSFLLSFSPCIYVCVWTTFCIHGVCSSTGTDEKCLIQLISDMVFFPPHPRVSVVVPPEKRNG